MEKFTEAFLKAREIVEKAKFSDEWQKFLSSKANIRKLLGEQGFAKGAAKTPAQIRNKIDQLAKAGSSSTGEVIYAAAEGGSPPTSLVDRAATLKMVRHVHRISEKGSQDVWVYSPPKEHSKWVFDELTGSAAEIKVKLAKDEELFSLEEMKWMSAALSDARKISEDTRARLTGILGVKNKTRELIRHWFLDQDCGDEKLTEAVAALSAGFKTIASFCNSSKLVFADYPDWRSKRDNYFGAAFRGGEGGGFPVVYLEGAFTRLTGNTGKQWLCAETIIHELSHVAVSTQDHRYDSHGLKPDKAAFPYAKAIDNADSWGYFALDVAGYLSKADHDNTWK